MDFAVIKFAGKQYLIKTGDIIEVEGLLEVGKKPLETSDVLLISQNEALTIGAPLVAGAKVTAEVISAGKGEKIRVMKFKAKSRYRRVMGFRPLISKLKILSISKPKVKKTK